MTDVAVCDVSGTPTQELLDRIAWSKKLKARQSAQGRQRRLQKKRARAAKGSNSFNYRGVYVQILDGDNGDLNLIIDSSCSDWDADDCIETVAGPPAQWNGFTFYRNGSGVCLTFPDGRRVTLKL